MKSCKSPPKPPGISRKSAQNPNAGTPFWSFVNEGFVLCVCVGHARSIRGSVRVSGGWFRAVLVHYRTTDSTV